MESFTLKLATAPTLPRQRNILIKKQRPKREKEKPALLKPELNTISQLQPALTKTSPQLQPTLIKTTVQLSPTVISTNVHAYSMLIETIVQLPPELVANQDGGDSAGVIDALFILQHPPVYTLGIGSTKDNLLFDPSTSPIPVYRTERGGEVTYHGPGQLVLYPILNLRRLQKMDLHWYLRTLEEVAIRALEEVSGIEAGRVDGLTGVWVEGAKVAAIGVRAKKWVTYHGVAINISTELTPFTGIVPCGIADRPVCSVMSILDGRSLSEDPYAPEDMEYVGAQTGEELLTEYRYALLAAFEELFGVQLEPAPCRPDELFRDDPQSVKAPPKVVSM
eukprot:gene2531-5482_t